MIFVPKFRRLRRLKMTKICFKSISITMLLNTFQDCHLQFGISHSLPLLQMYNWRLSDVVGTTF